MRKDIVIFLIFIFLICSFLIFFFFFNNSLIFFSPFLIFPFSFFLFFFLDAPWCGHCKNLVPHYAEAATKLAESGSPVKLAKLDATVHSESASKFGVRGYPTLKFFKNGVATDYTGGRTAAEIINWVSKKTGPSVATLSTVESLKEFVAANSLAAVGFLSATDAQSAFSTVADAIDDAKFALATPSAEFFAAFSLTPEESVVVFRKFPEEDEHVSFKGPFTSSAIQSFVRGSLLPLAVEFSDQTAPKIFGGDIKVHVLLFIKGINKPENAATLSDFRKAAAGFKGRSLFVIVDTEKPGSTRVSEYFGIKASPDIRLIKLGDDIEKYRLEPLELTTEAISNWANQYFEGKLTRYLMSEEPQANGGPGTVRVLVGKDHDSVVFDETKNVFVEYYAPWCGHCKKLAPIWEQLAKDYEGHENVIVAKMDSTVNEVASVSVQGFPTLKFYPAGSDRRVLDFNGGRELADLKKYLDENIVGATGSSDDHGHSHEHGHDHDHAHGGEL